MPTIADLRKHIKGYKADTVCAFDIWLVEDVQERCAQTDRKKLSKKDANEVLEIMDSRKDCNFGLNWDFMDCCIDDLETEKENKKKN